MRIFFSHEIDNNPEPEYAATIRVTATILGEDDIPTFTTLSLAKDFKDNENDECKSKEDFNYFLMEAGFNDDVVYDALVELIIYVDELTCPTSSEYSPGCALKVQLEIVPDYLDDECMAMLFVTNNVCPLCFVKLPCECEDQ
ncbi:unnamed protein product [Eruca vesicaria subsp. sativa]|uniref:Uncharacterized protein n=1 Tax=Eruca vesicaria subsp. sativa TaxID=29727 RepID=A0ABC8KFC6_ERUVS|nr:unnamed protein product [Eruca vesicaria subsp. sativa]